jgi:hypothetical protein
MTRLAPLLIAGMLLLASACAPRPDWIEATLVTVDVTGRWQGTLAATGGAPVGSVWVELMLEQHGARVTGIMRMYGPSRGFDGPVEGSVAGDVLRFQRGGFQGEATMNGDAMTGRFVWRGLTPEGRLLLRRIDRAAPAPAAKP